MLNFLWLHIKKILAIVGTAIAGTLLALLVATKRRERAGSALSQSEATKATVSQIEKQEKVLEALSNNAEKLVPRNADPDEIRRRLRERGLLK